MHCLAALNLEITTSEARVNLQSQDRLFSDSAYVHFWASPSSSLLPSIRSFIGSPQSEQGTEARRIGLPLKSDCIVAFVESPPPPPTPPPLRIVKPRSPMRQNLRNSKLLWVTFRFPHHKSGHNTRYVSPRRGPFRD